MTLTDPGCNPLCRAPPNACKTACGHGIAIHPHDGPDRARCPIRIMDIAIDSNFYYLSGFTEPEAVLVLVAGDISRLSILFCREKNWSARSGMATRFSGCCP